MKHVAFLAAAALLGGCLASGGEDPFAYTRKPLYTGGFDLASIAGGNDTQEFRVTDGSIAEIRIQVWINATAGGGRVWMLDPSGRRAFETTDSTIHATGLQLGVWTVQVEGQPESAGRIHILVTRA